MYESAAISTYLGDKFRDVADLVPTPGTQARGRYEQTVMCIQSELDSQALWLHRKHAALAGILAPPAPDTLGRTYVGRLGSWPRSSLMPEVSIFSVSSLRPMCFSCTASTGGSRSSGLASKSSKGSKSISHVGGHGRRART